MTPTPSDDVRNELHRKVRQELDRSRRNGSQMGLALVEIAATRKLEPADARKLVASVQANLGWQLRSYDQVFQLAPALLAVVLSDVRGTPETVASIADRINEAIQAPLKTPDGEIVPACRMSLSVGVAGVSAQEIVRRAIEASSRPRSGPGPEHYDRDLAREHQRLRTFHEALAAAIDDGGIDVAYQPLYDRDGETLVGVEALARWTHEGRPVPPAEFISYAEEHGLIARLGEVVLRKACEAGARWRDLSVAVNVSTVQLRDPTFPLTVQSITAETGMEPSRLEIEITENVFASDKEAVARRLSAIRATGVRLAVDDFGTGYSSLSYLRSFPLDRIKIDRSFVADGGLVSRVIVENILRLGDGLGIQVTAEGVETEAQRTFLSDRGCHRFQGYLFSKPVDAAAIDDMLMATVPGGP